MKIVFIPKFGLGDLIFALPFMWSLREAYPDADIYIRTASTNKELLDIIGGGFKYSFWSGGCRTDIKNYKKRVEYEKLIQRKDLEKLDIDLLINIDAYYIGIAKRELCSLDIGSSKYYLDDVDGDHTTDKILNFADVLGIKRVLDFRFENLKYKNTDRSSYCIIQLSCKEGARSYSTKKWFDYISTLREHNKILIGDHTKFKLSKVLEIIPNTYNLLYRQGFSTDLLTYMSLAKEADFVVSCDTGLLHMADAIGSKVIGLYNKNKNTSKVNWPYHNKQNIIWSKW